jgi:hypothetical protein
MIQVKISGKTAELRPDTVINFRLNNPLFNEDNLSPGSYTLPFDMAGAESSPQNAAIFLNPDVIENVVTFKKQVADIHFDGIPFKNGKIKPKTITPTSITSNFVFGLSTISDEIKTKKIRDLLDEEVIISTNTVEKKLYIKPGVVNTGPYIILVNDRQYQADSLADLVDAINTDTTEPRAKATLFTTGTSPTFAAPFIELENFDDPLDVLAPLSVKPAEYNGNYSIGFQWEVHASGLNIGDNYYAGFFDYLEPFFNGTYPNNKVRFPFCFNTNMYGEEIDVAHPYGITKSTNFVNACRSSINPVEINSANYGVAENAPFEVRNYNSIQPFLRLKYILEKIAEYFDFEFEGDWYTDPNVDNMLIWNTAPLDVPLDFIGERKFVFWARSYNLKNLCPDLTVIDFLKTIQSRYNLGIYINEETGKVRICKREEIALAIAYSDITMHASPIKGIDDESVSGFTFTSERDTNDAASLTDTYIVGEGEEQITTALGAMRGNLTITNVRGTTGNVTGVYASQPQGSDFKFRIFYYRGIIDNTHFTYPGSTYSTGDFLETFNGLLLPGLYDTFWKRWQQYRLNRKLISLDITFYFVPLINFNWEIKRRFDRNNYLVKSMDFALKPTGLSVVKAELYTMV